MGGVQGGGGGGGWVGVVVVSREVGVVSRGGVLSRGWYPGEGDVQGGGVQGVRLIDR